MRYLCKVCARVASPQVKEGGMRLLELHPECAGMRVHTCTHSRVCTHAHIHIHVHTYPRIPRLVSSHTLTCIQEYVDTQPRT